MIDLTNYDVKRLFKDEGFENGFDVLRVMNGAGAYDNPVGKFQYPTSTAAPSWLLIQWYSRKCLIGDRKDTGNPYEITDVDNIKFVKYNPEEKSLLMTLNAKNAFKGKSKMEDMPYWPHLLIEQKNICDYKNMTDPEEKKFYSTAGDKVYAEFDMRVLDFKPTTNPEDLNAVQFVAYVYLQLVDAGHIYFGFNPFDNRGPIKFLWKKETGGSNWIYGLPTEVTFGSIENSFVPTPHDVKVSKEWKHIEVDLTPHIDNIIEMANKDMIFGRKVTKSDFYFSGTNMGFETHGNIDCAIEIKNYNIVSCFKKN